MNPKHTLVAVLGILAVGGVAVCAERIILKSGAEIIGPILRSDKKVVVVDLDCQVIRLPRSEVAKIIKHSPTTKPGAVVEEKGTKWQLYRTGRFESTTIEKNTERFGQAVVMVTTPAGQGSGFIVTPDGYLITNYHVIAQETRVKVTVFEKTDSGYEQKHYKKVKIIAINPFIDLALLKIESKTEKFTHVYMSSMAKLEAGQQVFAIGNPLGLTRTVSQGIISTKNRSFGGRLYIQTTADINPGNSGGPLFSLTGEVIGVTSMGYLYLGGLNFAVPADVVKRFIKNRDAFAYDEDNPNSGHRYLQPATRSNRRKPPAGKVPSVPASSKKDKKAKD